MNKVEFKERYCIDVIGAGVVNPNYKFKTDVEKRLAPKDIENLKTFGKNLKEKIDRARRDYDTTMKLFRFRNGPEAKEVKEKAKKIFIEATKRAKEELNQMKRDRGNTNVPDTFFWKLFGVKMGLK